MKKITTEIIKIIVSILLMFSGLALMLRYLDARLLIGFLLMGIGVLMWVFMVIGVIKHGS